MTRIKKKTTAPAGEGPVWSLVQAETKMDGGKFVVDPNLDVVEGRLSSRAAKLSVSYRACANVLLSAYRLVFRVRLEGGHPLRVHHQAMTRLHREMTLPAAVKLGDPKLFRTTWTTPGNFNLPYGDQDMALHPAFVIFEPKGKALVLAPLSQEKAKAAFHWTLLDPRTAEVSVEFSFLGLKGLALSPNTVFPGEEMYLETFGPDVPFGPAIFQNYHDLLLGRGGLGYRARRSPLIHDEIFWGTWNEGNCRNISTKIILKEARWLARNFPNVKWIQIDDGFHARGDEKVNGKRYAYCDIGAHWREKDALCKRRFPEGMAYLTQKIKELGLHPMIWFCPASHVDLALYRERPDLFVPDARLHFETKLAFPDYSLPEMRDIALRALDRLFLEWGFEGIKLDFWTYGFEQQRLHLRHPGTTNLEWMSWLSGEIRQRLGPKGLMLSCLEPANGDPFRSKFWDMHRIGPDIDGVTVPVLEEIAVWIASLVGLKQTQRDFWIPDADGFSLSRHPERSDNHWHLFVALMVVSGTALEIAGLYSRLEKDPRLPAFREILKNVRHGQRVTFPGFDWIENKGKAPNIWVRHDDDGKRLLGLINWSGEVRSFRVTAEDLQVPRKTKLQNLFTRERISLPTERTISGEDAELWKTE